MKTKVNRKVSRADRLVIIIFYFFLTLFSLFCLFPFAVAISGSLSSENSIIREGFSILPRDLTLDTYRYVFANQGYLIGRAYLVTVTATVLGTTIAILVTSSYAFVLSIKDYRHRNKLAFFSYFAMLFNGGMLPWYIILTQYYGLKNSIWALTLPYVFNVFYMYLMRNFFSSLPYELVESAKIDGAGPFRIYLQIMLPLSKSGLLTVVLFYGLSYWNDFFLPLMLVTDQKYHTVQFILYKMMANIQFLVSNSQIAQEQAVALPAQTIKMAITCIAIGPIVLLYPFVQKHFIQGVTVGALKG